MDQPYPLVVNKYINRLFAGIDALARHRLMSILVVFLLCFGGSWIWAIIQGISFPYHVDEFGYVLSGDTFAHGRLTNPPHPMWVHFETYNVLQHPTYMSKFPPGQGIFLAIGQVFFGHQIYGVWLSAGLMCAAICWMLYAWVPPPWALLGGLVAVLQFSVFTYWSQSYWGGAVAGIGGALVFGALPRIFKTQRIRDALWLGLGCAILANSRPLEGFLVAIPVGCLVLPWKSFFAVIPAKGPHTGHSQLFAGIHNKFIKKVILPLSMVLFITALLMGAYNKQITGKVNVFPYLLFAHTYREVPLFMWQPLTSPVKFNHKALGLHDKYYLEKNYFDKKTWKGFVEDMQKDSVQVSMFFFGYPLAIPSLAILVYLFFLRQTAARYWLALLVLLGTCAAMTCPMKAHYFSPLTCLAVLLVTIGLRGLGELKLRNVRVGLVAGVFLIALQLLLNIILTPHYPVAWSMAETIQSSPIKLQATFTREDLKNILMKRGGKYLVIVKYPLWHYYFREWVYNDADIDNAPIVWARDMDEGHNKELLEYFRGRQILFISIFWEKPGGMFYDSRQ